YDVTAIAVPQGDGPHFELRPNDPSVVVSGEVRFHEKHCPSGLEKLGKVGHMADAAIHRITKIPQFADKPEAPASGLRSSATGRDFNLVGGALVNARRFKIRKEGSRRERGRSCIEPVSEGRQIAIKIRRIRHRGEADLPQIARAD